MAPNNQWDSTRQRIPDVRHRSWAIELADYSKTGVKVSFKFSRMRGRKALHG